VSRAKKVIDWAILSLIGLLCLSTIITACFMFSIEDVDMGWFFSILSGLAWISFTAYGLSYFHEVIALKEFPIEISTVGFDDVHECSDSGHSGRVGYDVPPGDD